MALALDAGVLNHGPGVGLETGHGAANVAVDLDNLLDGGGFEEGGGDSLFDSQDNAFGGGDADGGGAELDCFKRVFDLEETTFGGEGVDTPIWRWKRMQLAQRISYCLAVCWCICMAACLFLHSQDTSASSWAFAQSFSNEEGSADEGARGEMLAVFRSCHKHLGGLCELWILA